MKDINIEEAKDELTYLYEHSFNSDDSYYIVMNFIDNLEKEKEELKKQLSITNKTLDKACALAIQGNNAELSIAINKGTKEQYNLPLTLDSMSNRKILKDYLLKESENTNENN